MKRLGLGIIVAIGLTLRAFGQQAVNPEGIWHLNPAKSTIRSPTIIKSQTLNYSGDGLTSTGFGFDGKPFTIASPLIADGKSRPFTGSPGYDAVTYTQLDPYTISISRTKAGKVVETGTRIFSPNGNLIMLTAIATDGSYSNVAVYEKQ
jgi:hypothetical protein